jgi:hypothetical protein
VDMIRHQAVRQHRDFRRPPTAPRPRRGTCDSPSARRRRADDCYRAV